MEAILGIIIAALLSQNFILVKFYGICPFMGVSKKIDTALGMGMAVTFVMGLASAVCYGVYQLLVLLDLTYIKNTGAAFSILEKHTWLLTVLSAVIVLVVAYLVVKKFFNGWVGMLSATLILAGGVGNLIDRAAFKYVTDMIKTTFIDFPVFNFADCCITVGVVLLVIYVLFFCKDEKKEGDHGADLPDDQ